MNTSKLTDKAQEAIVAAQRLAEDSHHTQLEPEHLLFALVSQEDGVVPAILERLEIPHADRSRRAPTGARRLRAWLRPDPGLGLEPVPPRVRRCRQGGRAAQGRLRLDRTFPARPRGRFRDRGRRPDATPAGCHTRQALFGAAGDPWRPARDEPDPRDDLPVAREVRTRPDGARPAGKARPGHRPRRGGPPDHAGPVAEDQEQPGPHRRAGRRQDRDRRGACPADRPRRRARGPQGQADRRARPRGAGRRRQVPRRVRGAAQGRAQGGDRLRWAGDPVHRRASHRCRGGRGRGFDGRLEHAQADACPRRAAHDRRDDAR